MNYQPASPKETIILNNGMKHETIRELAKRHLMDPNHTTTDEELKNATLEFDLYTLPDRKLNTTANQGRRYMGF